MKILNVEIKTKSEEHLLLNEVYSIFIGKMGLRDGKLNPWVDTDKLVIESDKGMMTFPLDDIESIAFSLLNENKKTIIDTYSCREREYIEEKKRL